MKKRNLAELFKRWQLEVDDPDLEPNAIAAVQHLGARLFNDYEPSFYDPFEIRLENWLNNVSDEREKKIMLSAVAHLFYAGPREFGSLYASAFNQICSWIIETESMNINDSSFQGDMQREVAATWICPATDSMRINAFLKVNGLEGHDFRPDWRSLREFADIENINIYMDAEEIKRVVILEDFVGSALQIEPVVNFVLDNFPDRKFLMCPLISCPTGFRHIGAMIKNSNNVYIKSPLVIPDEHFLKDEPLDGEPKIYTEFREVIKKYGPIAENSHEGIFGFGELGGMIVLHSNCPDNTVPIIWAKNDNWNPLFPRIKRRE